MNETLVDILGEARAVAAREGLRERTVCYVTRGRRELLVFEHAAEYPDAGVQAPGGGVEAGETPAEGAAREVFEETGLSGLSGPVYLGSGVQVFEARRQMNHFFWHEAPEETRDAWEHFAEGQYIFLHRFAPLEDPGLDWGMDAFLPALRRRLEVKDGEHPESTPGPA